MIRKFLIFILPYICMFVSAHYDRTAYTVAFGVVALGLLILKVVGELIGFIVSCVKEEEEEDGC